MVEFDPHLSAQPHGRRQSALLYIRYGTSYNPFRTYRRGAMPGRITRQEDDWCLVPGASEETVHAPIRCSGAKSHTWLPVFFLLLTGKPPERRAGEEAQAM